MEPDTLLSTPDVDTVDLKSPDPEDVELTRGVPEVASALRPGPLVSCGRSGLSVFKSLSLASRLGLFNDDR